MRTWEGVDLAKLRRIEFIRVAGCRRSTGRLAAGELQAVLALVMFLRLQRLLLWQLLLLLLLELELALFHLIDQGHIRFGMPLALLNGILLRSLLVRIRCRRL